MTFLLKKFKHLKASGHKITVVTAYDYWSARLVNQSQVDAILVGDCSTMVMHGENNTIATDLQVLAQHVRDVAKGAPDKMIIASMPFMSLALDRATAMENVKTLMQAGAAAVKIEGVEGNEEVIKALVKAGIPVIGHTGLKPSQHHVRGGFKAQGHDEEDALQIIEEARAFERLGVICIVLEAVVASLGGRVRDAVSVPVVGVGAGVDCDGQALVLHDLLGLMPEIKPRFVRTYLQGARLFIDAINQFVEDCRTESFPSERESYHAPRAAAQAQDLATARVPKERAS